ncbi:MAG: hypothetical protein E7447_00880 [Ruminococcaceae bacterium]|nr:hypothetical protein [Oscillospiraceae bacterium]
MDTKIADAIYDLLMGEADPTEYFRAVENMFAEGRTCEELYSKVYEANLRLCDRLGVQEDADVELIIDSLLRISRLLGIKMFQYGIKYQSGDL